MTTKAELKAHIRRLTKAIDLIDKHEYSTQEDLNEDGHAVSQAMDQLLDLAADLRSTVEGIKAELEWESNPGRAITMVEFERMTDEELAKTIDPCWRGAFPGKEFCTEDLMFYLHDGGYYNFLTGETEGWRD